MKCNRCDQPATLHLTQVVNDKVTKIHLCAGCAQAAGIGPGSDAAAVSAYLLGQGVPMLPASRNKVCPECRMTLLRFRKEGRLGCPKCYDSFAGELEQILQSTHAATEHHGRRPRRATSVKSWREEARALESRLAEAVAAEAYEDAARLRDELKSLQTRHTGAGV